MTEQQLDIERTNIGKELQSRRRALKISQEELAERTGMQTSTISKIERGIFWANLKQYLILMDALNLERLEPVWK